MPLDASIIILIYKCKCFDEEEYTTYGCPERRWQLRISVMMLWEVASEQRTQRLGKTVLVGFDAFSRYRETI
jgi:hypothetical protein